MEHCHHCRAFTHHCRCAAQPAPTTQPKDSDYSYILLFVLKILLAVLIVVLVSLYLFGTEANEDANRFHGSKVKTDHQRPESVGIGLSPTEDSSRGFSSTERSRAEDSSRGFSGMFAATERSLTESVGAEHSPTDNSRKEISGGSATGRPQTEHSQTENSDRNTGINVATPLPSTQSNSPRPVINPINPVGWYWYDELGNKSNKSNEGKIEGGKVEEGKVEGEKVEEGKEEGKVGEEEYGAGFDKTIIGDQHVHQSDRQPSDDSEDNDDEQIDEPFDESTTPDYFYR